MIDNLYALEKLEKLQLDNNIITKIQNLDHLVNLKWLDLSFNSIKVIEGLDNLANLTDLSLFSNQIEEVKGLDNLSKLNVLSLGSNMIKQYDTVILYLRDLKNNLEVLKISDNPFTKYGENEYKQFSIAYLKELKYLDYELINETVR
eukprot:CAMPEP_0170554728 /NCGR_PEP_ID=MMETSP0211-20121228/12605_1 /TAXON_ID=311385 /ORGANISM="Pseudokeronopsis sp., Strain OXSARD2" /LENGTH=146 /DNA_ID=CAMNT_0010864033 /DNA_START=1 /DNA_END=441 /DNA_ORIENTATION=+